MISFLFASMMLFAKADIMLTQHNHCVLADAVEADVMHTVKQCLIKQNKTRGLTNYPIYLVLDTPGGSVYDGLKFIQFVKTIPNVHTITIFAASMGSAIVEHLPGKRYGTDNAITMFHRASGTFSGQFGTGEVEEQLKLWTKIVGDMEEKSSARIGIALSKYRKKVVNEWWIYGEDNILQNTLDEIVTVKCSEYLMQNTVTKKIETFIGTFTYEESLCPVAN